MNELIVEKLLLKAAFHRAGATSSGHALNTYLEKELYGVSEMLCTRCLAHSKQAASFSRYGYH